MTDPPVQGETEHVSEGPGLLTDHSHNLFTLEYKKIEENVGTKFKWNINIGK